MVKRRGALMGQVSGGGMAAVIGMEPARIQARARRRPTPAGTLDVANFNSFDQTVIAGPTDAIAAVKPQFEEAGVRAFIPLKVSAPFHSRYMREPQAEFAAFLDGVHVRPPAIPVDRERDGAAVRCRRRVRDTLASQIGSAVRWLDSMVFLLDQGVTEFEEVGPGSVLTKLVAQIKKKRA